MNKPRKIDWTKTAELRLMSMWYKNRIHGYQIYAVNQSRGRCRYDHKYVTVPTWAWYQGYDYVTYYLAHEVSHMVAKEEHGCVGHGPDFYEVFKRLCPKHLQHYEYGYKPRLAQAAGIPADT